MAYDIPDEIKYREKIIANLDSRQLIYAALFGFLAFLAFRLPVEGELKFALPTLISLIGVGFVFLNLGGYLKDIFSFYFAFRKAEYKESAAQRFFEVKSVSDNVIHLDNGKMLAVLEVQPVNFKLMDDGRKLAIISNYKAFLNQLTTPVQILVRTKSVNLEDYFNKTNGRRIKDGLLLSLYSDFRIFEEDFLSSNSIKERQFYLIVPFTKNTLPDKQIPPLKLLEDLMGITQEKLAACGLEMRRLNDAEITDLLYSYGSSSEDNEERPDDLFNSVVSRITSGIGKIKTLNRHFPGYAWQIKLGPENVTPPLIRNTKKTPEIFSLGKARGASIFQSIGDMGLCPPPSTILQFAGSDILYPKQNIKITGRQFGYKIPRNRMYPLGSGKLVWPESFGGWIKDEVEPEPGNFRQDITPSFDIRKNCAYVNEEIHRIVKVAGYPRKVEDGWLQAFLTKNENYDVIMHIDPASINARLVYLHNQIIQQTSDLVMSTSKGTPNPALEIKKADTARVYDSLYKGEEKMFDVSIYLDNHAPTIPDLGLLTEKCKSNLNAQMMVPKVTEWRMADGIKSTLPIASNPLAAGRDFLTNSLAASFPFISPSNTKKNGILFAREADTMTPLFLDFRSMNNKHFFIIGISGSGKSYTSKYLVMQQLFAEDTKVFILDPNGEYVPLCKSLGGQVIELSRDSRSTINIFDLGGNDYSDKMLSLLSAFDIIVGGLTESQKGVLSKVLTRAYARKGVIHSRPETWDRDAPTFSDIRDAALEIKAEFAGGNEYLKDPSIEALLNRIEMYCQSGLFGFLDQPSKLDVNKGFVCFDLSKLPHAVKNLLMFATLEIIRQEISKDKKPKIVLIDEGWSLLRNREAANYILEFVKTSRKFNTSLGFVTQEIEDLLRSRTGKSILNTASVKILMRQNPSNIDLISDTLKLNPATKEYLLTARNGHGLLFTEQNAFKFFVKASDKLHALITTKPEEQAQKPEKKPKMKAIIDLEKGLYLKNEISDEEEACLLQNGYEPCKGRTTKDGGSTWFFVKVRHNEGAEHAYLCWVTYELALKRFDKVEMNATSGGDVIIDTGTKRVAFEIETGSNLTRHTDEFLKEKFQRLTENFDDYYIIASDYDFQKRYRKYGKVILRNKIEETLAGIGRQ